MSAFVSHPEAWFVSSAKIFRLSGSPARIRPKMASIALSTWLDTSKIADSALCPLHLPLPFRLCPFPPSQPSINCSPFLCNPCSTNFWAAQHIQYITTHTTVCTLFITAFNVPNHSFSFSLSFFQHIILHFSAPLSCIRFPQMYILFLFCSSYNNLFIFILALFLDQDLWLGFSVILSLPAFWFFLSL